LYLWFSLTHHFFLSFPLSLSLSLSPTFSCLSLSFSYSLSDSLSVSLSLSLHQSLSRSLSRFRALSLSVSLSKLSLILSLSLSLCLSLSLSLAFPLVVYSTALYLSLTRFIFCSVSLSHFYSHVCLVAHRCPLAYTYLIPLLSVSLSRSVYLCLSLFLFFSRSQTCSMSPPSSLSISFLSLCLALSISVFLFSHSFLGLKLVRCRCRPRSRFLFCLSVSLCLSLFFSFLILFSVSNLFDVAAVLALDFFYAGQTRPTSDVLRPGSRPNRAGAGGVGLGRVTEGRWFHRPQGAPRPCYPRFEGQTGATRLLLTKSNIYQYEPGLIVVWTAWKSSLLCSHLWLCRYSVHARSLYFAFVISVHVIRA